VRTRITVTPIALVLSIAAVLLLSTGCADKKKASTSVFESALEGHFKSRPVCLATGVAKFPDVVQYSANGKPQSMNANMEEALVSAKLLTAKQEMKPISNVWTGQTTVQHVVTYSVADPSQWGQRSANFLAQSPCYAKIKIESVDNFTEPSDFMGQHISKVEFTYKLTDVQSWIHTPALEQAVPGVKQLSSTDERKGTAALILTNNGWEVDPAYYL
jgi:hypothetical protein